jgi:hypothetical protein
MSSDIIKEAKNGDYRYYQYYKYYGDSHKKSKKTDFFTKLFKKS